jgi:hypothetical protein
LKAETTKNFGRNKKKEVKNVWFIVPFWHMGIFWKLQCMELDRIDPEPGLLGWIDRRIAGLDCKAGSHSGVHWTPHCQRDLAGSICPWRDYPGTVRVFETGYWITKGKEDYDDDGI